MIDSKKKGLDGVGRRVLVYVSGLAPSNVCVCTFKFVRGTSDIPWLDLNSALHVAPRRSTRQLRFLCWVHLRYYPMR